jgi:hypothetical protein
MHWDGTALTAPVQLPAPLTPINWRSIAGAGMDTDKIVYFVGDAGAAGFSVPASPNTVTTYTFNCDKPAPQPAIPPNWRSSYCTSLPGFVDCWFGAEDGGLTRYWNKACARFPTNLSAGVTITSIWEGYDGTNIDVRLVGTGGAVRRSVRPAADCKTVLGPNCPDLTNPFYDGPLRNTLGAGATAANAPLFLSGPADASEVWVTGVGGAVGKWIATQEKPLPDQVPFSRQPSTIISALSGGYADSSGNLLVPGKTPVRMVYLGPLLPTK